MNDKSSILLRQIIFVVIFCFFQMQIFAQSQRNQRRTENQYNSILDKVYKNIRENYDSIMFHYENYNEIVYIDSTKEIVNAVNINSLRRESGIFPRYSRHRGNLLVPSFSTYLFSGSLFGEEENIGYADIMSKAAGMHAYSGENVDIIGQLLMDNESKKHVPPPSFFENKTLLDKGSLCASGKLKERHIQYEVKDTLYNQTDCFLLRITRKSAYFLPENYPDVVKIVTGNWDPHYSTNVETTIINKSDYAVLMWRINTTWTNDHNESRTYFHTTQYKKTGNYYYRSYYEQRLPRFFEFSEGGIQASQRGGFNDLDMYTLIVRESENAKIDSHKEKEMRLDQMKGVPSKPGTMYDSFLKKQSTVSEPVMEFWGNYWNKD